ncbi:MAG: polysaccharide biosynthesis protein [Candidatus Electrothrix sp. AW2]|nr:polysaccharide biosynthesis protein [Candidatus Electrothrix gigas]
MTLLKKNILANFAGNIWTALMGLAFVPLYIHFMGIEAYGLTGFFAALLGVFGILDMGLSTTLNREMARLSVQQDKAQEMRDLLRTLEIPYWLVALLIGIIVLLVSPFIAYHWVKVKELSPDSVHTAVMLMGLCLAFQWPMGFYSGGLMGLQRHVLLNTINVVAATFRGIGAVLVIWLISPTVEAFFWWQAVVSAFHIMSIVFFVWHSLPSAPKLPRFRQELLRNIWRFAAGMTGITLTVFFLVHLDKIILSRILSLEMFGYYTLAYVVAGTLYRVIGPVYSATYPKMTTLVESGNEKELIQLYHKSAQLISVLVLPVALVIAFFSKEILLIWTKDPVTTENTYLLVSILVMGTAFNGLMHIPFALQLAHGWTRLALSVNIVSVLILVPLLIVFAQKYGAVGAASIWLILNTNYVLITPTLMHRRLLSAEKWRWYIKDVGRPLLAAAVVCFIVRLIIQSDWSVLPLVVGIGLTSGIALLAAAFSGNRLDVVRRVI